MEKVFLINAPKYDPLHIAGSLRKAAKELKVSTEKPSAVLLADCPWAHPKYAPHAHTHPEFIAGVAGALQPALITIAANSLAGFPTRYSFRQARYPSLCSHLKARLVPLDEAATRKVPIQDGQVVTEANLPAVWMDAPLRVMMPKLRQSTLVPFAGGLRLMHSLLQQDAQLLGSHRLPEKLIDLMPVTPVDLIAVDAIQVLHKGGELSGQPQELGVMIVGTNPVAVDIVCAIALGLEPANVDFLKEARERGCGPGSLADIQILGDLTLADLRQRALKVEFADPDPAHFPLPPQVSVIRSEKARQSGVSGTLADVLFILRNASVSLKSALQTAIVIGVVDRIPAGKDEYSTLIFMDDTSRGDFAGYGRIIRLAGRNIALSQVLKDVPYVMKVLNLQAELGADFMIAKLMANLQRLLPRK